MALSISVIPEMVIRKRTSDNIDQVFLGQCLAGDRVGTILFDISLNKSFFVYSS